jgi:hypothetical protein
VKSIHVENQLGQAQLKQLQEDEKTILTELDTKNDHTKNLKLEDEDMLKEHLTPQTMESFENKSTQVKTSFEEISSRFQELEKYV